MHIPLASPSYLDAPIKGTITFLFQLGCYLVEHVIIQHLTLFDLFFPQLIIVLGLFAFWEVYVYDPNHAFSKPLAVFVLELE